MEKTLQIKEFDSNDRDFIINGLMALQEHEVALHDTRRVASRDLCEKYFEEIYENALAYNGALLLGCVEGVPAGFICFWIRNDSAIMETDDSNHYGYISDIYVAGEHRGQGFAQQMLQEVERRIANDGSVSRLRICSLAMNSLAVEAYQRAAFKPYEITYEKRLEP